MRGRVEEGPGAAAPHRAAPSVPSAREAPGWTPDLRAPPAGGEEGLAAWGVNTTRGGREAGIASPELFKKASAGARRFRKLSAPRGSGFLLGALALREAGRLCGRPGRGNTPALRGAGAALPGRHAGLTEPPSWVAEGRANRCWGRGAPRVGPGPEGRSRGGEPRDIALTSELWPEVPKPRQMPRQMRPPPGVREHPLPVPPPATESKTARLRLDLRGTRTGGPSRGPAPSLARPQPPLSLRVVSRDGWVSPPQRLRSDVAPACKHRKAHVGGCHTPASATWFSTGD